MEIDTQLLCTFTSTDSLDSVIHDIKITYKLVFNKIYVLENVNDPKQLVLTYNVSKKLDDKLVAPTSTISVHRKKYTNTIYTINAINRLIEEKNGGVLDKSYKIDWDELKNTVLVTAYGKLKVVNTKLSQIIDC